MVSNIAAFDRSITNAPTFFSGPLTLPRILHVARRYLEVVLLELVLRASVVHEENPQGIPGQTSMLQESHPPDWTNGRV